ncbi:MAG TPA: glycosyltransferase, partial [Solirubrobacterales bacterium]|nr:glycosyltransferase [Solirubrobacterales bacterium]
FAFTCEDHRRSAAALHAIEDVYGDEPPDYLEVPDYRGHGLVPLQAKRARHRSLRGCTMAVRLRGMAEPICLHDGVWPQEENKIVFDIEREALRLADLIVFPGGEVPALYERHLGRPLPRPAKCLRLPLEQPPEPPQPGRRDSRKPLDILYAGRLQRVKGVLELVEACMELDRDWRLTMVGGDTSTAPLGWSMRDTIETVCAGEDRVTLLERVAHEEVQSLYSQHDLLVVPSRFEVWPNVALEAMRAGLPVLATPVGGLTEIVDHGVTGWHIPGADGAAIHTALERLLASREEIEEVRASGEVFRRFQRLTDPDAVLAEYEELFAGLRTDVATRGRLPASAPEPSVTGIVPYFGEHEMVGEAVRSLLGQTHRNLTVTIVNDGSFEPEDAVLDELEADPRVRVLTKPNGGDHTARNLAIRDAESKYVAMLDADNVFEPEFVERGVAMCEADPELAYVTCWLRLLNDPVAASAFLPTVFPPLGNAVRSDDRVNTDGDTMALLPRRAFTGLGYWYEKAGLTVDWELYRTLRDDGRYGAVIPELLGRYRVRGGSMSRAFAVEARERALSEGLSRRRLRSLA